MTGPLTEPPSTTTLTAGSLARRPWFKPGWLLGGERDYPATLPARDEFQRWFLTSLGVLGIALLAAGSVGSVKPSWSRPILWGMVIAAGLLGGPLWHALGGGYLFLWPLVLWCAFQGTVNQSWRIGAKPMAADSPGFLGTSLKNQERHRWRRALAGPRMRSYVAGGVFLATCAVYFHFCRWLGLAIEWGFLVGFAAALPAALVAAGWATRPGARFFLAQALALAASFSLYYWGSVWFLVWRLGSTGSV